MVAAFTAAGRLDVIPRRIHLWWHGTPPGHVQQCAEQWGDVNRGWDVTLWGDQFDALVAVDTARRNEQCVYPSDHVRHYSNLVRWRLLNLYGGVWVDCDTEPLLSLEGLIQDPTPFCASMVGPEPTVIGGPAAHSLWGALYRQSQRTTALCTAPEMSGARLLGRILEGDRQDMRIMEPGCFFDKDARGRTVVSRAPRYARHQWATSSARWK